MDCCYPVECEEYAVTPMLITPSPKYCEEETICYPCLPRCSKPAYYCCEGKAPRTSQRSAPPPAREREYCNPITNRCCPQPLPPPTRQEPCPPPAPSCNTCCHPPCKPVKTKYIMPCYRYEDGRIANQPTVLMRRACEVACGTRARRKPFIVSSYAADSSSEIRRYHSEDERGNCCFHFERKKPVKCSPYIPPCPPCVSCPECQYVDCVYAKPVNTPSCCYYCR